MNETIQIEKQALEKLLRHIEWAYTEGFRDCQFSDDEEKDFFNRSASKAAITKLIVEFNIPTKCP